MIDSTFWLAIASFIFLAATYRPIKKALLEYLDKEIKNVKDNISEASSLKADATTLVTDLKCKLAEYEHERDLMIMRSKEQSQKRLEQNHLELELLLARKQKEITLRIEQLKLDAINHIKNELGEKATNLAIFYLKEHQNSLPKDAEITTRLLSGLMV